VSKSDAVLWIACNHRIKKEHMISIGNDYNDFDLLEISGKAFVVDNAPPDLKNRFHVVSSNDNGGVTEAILKGFK
jgi:hydroxymethylpyrimidine pyrophosphatase-like HAD family hydrolase